MSENQGKKQVAIVGGGPAGLFAAERLAAAGAAVTVYDRMPTVARKFMMAGRGGLNLTHSEPFEDFLRRYGAAAAWIEPFLRAFSPADLRAWSEGLGCPTFVGSSGRIFPRELKASPLLRAWLRRLEAAGVRFALRQRWLGWDAEGALRFAGEDGQEKRVSAEAVLLALGGASWPRLGADGGWVDILRARGVEVVPLRPANCGFVAPWREAFAARYAGQPLKPVVASFGGVVRQGEAMLTAQGLEGGVIYALSAALRDAIEARGEAVLTLDLRPGLTVEALARRLSAPRGSRSTSTFLRQASGLSAAAAALAREAAAGGALPVAPEALATLLKSVPVRLTATAPIARAISSAGGVACDELDAGLMLKKHPGVFIAGEMIDWEAPTGGYLLQACFATGAAAARGMAGYLGLVR